METETAIPAHCVWRAMRKHTTKAISREAVREMQRYLTESVKTATARADTILEDWNKRLSPRQQRKRLTPELIREVTNAV